MRRDGCEVKAHSSGVDSLVRTVLKLKAAQQEDNLFHDPLRIEMVCAMARISDQRCEVFTLENGSCMVAALVTLVDRGCHRMYATYYDKRWAKSSLGVCLLHQVIKMELDNGIVWDLM